jgi:hypothetical protein
MVEGMGALAGAEESRFTIAIPGKYRGGWLNGP